MKLKDLIKDYGECDVVLYNIEGTNRIKIEGRKPENRTVWDLKDGDSYYWIEGLGYIKGHYFWKTESADFAARDIGNIFLTKEEAEKEVERRKTEILLLKYGGRRWFKEEGDNFYLVRECGDFETYQAYCILPLGTIYFDTEEQAKKAISEIGEERLKRALFEVR